MRHIDTKNASQNLEGIFWRAYCKLCDPIEAFLLSSAGMGILNKILVNLGRQDLPNFGDGKTVKMMQVARWDISSNNIDNVSLVPKIF